MPAFQRQDIEDVPGLECGVDIPFAPDFYSFNAVQDRDHKPSGLNGSLLAQGIGSTKREISVGQLGGRSSGTDGDHLIEGIPKQEFHDQIRATSTLAQGPNKHTIQAHTSPVFSASSLYGNTLRGSSNVRPQSPLGAAVLNPQITRPTSGLRNQYQLERPTQFSPTTYPSQPQTQDQHFPNMSPTDRVLGLQHLNGQTANTYQPFPLYSESYMRTPINQAPPQYNSSYQFRQQHDQHARTFSPLPSIIAQTPYHHQILDTPPMMRPMMRPIQPRTPPQTNVAEINQMPMLNTSTPSKIKHEDSSPRSTTRRRRESTIVAPTEMDSDSSASRDTGVPNSKEEDRQCIDDLVSAMMDGNDAEDNDGMIKTWNKLKLTKEAKIQHKCVELLVRQR